MTEVETVPVVSKTTNMGFTGHEQIDSVGLVHMGGRLYDAVLGRMLNADPFIQAPGNSQSFNRYSYVVNNPVSFNDPSGYMFNPIKVVASVISQMVTVIGDYYAMLDDIHRMVFDAAAQELRNFARNNPRTFALLQAAGCAAPGVGIAACAVMQGVATGIVTKDVFAGLQTAATAYAYGKAAEWIGHGGEMQDSGVRAPGIADKAERVLAHGAIGGANSAINGGNFFRGALSSMAAEGFAEYVPGDWRPDGDAGRLAHGIEGALIGGTAAVITGGGSQAFANGAMSGAMSRLFNFDGGEPDENGWSCGVTPAGVSCRNIDGRTKLYSRDGTYQTAEGRLAEEAGGLSVKDYNETTAEEVVTAAQIVSIPIIGGEMGAMYLGSKTAQMIFSFSGTSIFVGTTGYSAYQAYNNPSIPAWSEVGSSVLLQAGG